ncbi:MAG: DVU_1553 family AMP-dependent CoA ligase [Thermotaleaceae bacterium]
MRRTPLESWIVNKTKINERSKRALEAYQLKKVRETVGYAKENSGFYRELLKDIVIADLQSLEDLQKLPFTSSQDVRKKSHGFLCVPQREVKRIVTLNTSGTSGEEKRIFFTKEDLDCTIDFFKYGMSSLVDHRDRVLILLPGSAYGSIGNLLRKALEMWHIGCIVHGLLADPEEVARCIEEEDITCIVGVPMQVLYLSRVKSEVFNRRIKKVLLSTDYVPEVLIDELTHKHGCSTFTHYGMTEMGYGGGVECEALKGYHMREGDLYFEIINPDTGKAVEKGQYGEVVFTTLTRQAMPLIRYRTGDMAAFSSINCPCGTFLNTMKRAQGRMENRVELGKNQFLCLRELDEIIWGFEDILDYKASIDVKGKFLLEITTKNEEIFYQIKDETANKVEDILHHKLGSRLEMKIIFNSEKQLTSIPNSMIKRKIHDYRKG